MKGDVAGVVVNYNAREHLLGCVASLLSEGVGTVIVADNGSVDGSQGALLARYPEVKWAETGSNLGYGGAADLGAALSDSTYLLICNPDVVLGEGSTTTLRRFLDARPDVAVVGRASSTAGASCTPRPAASRTSGKRWGMASSGSSGPATLSRAATA